MNHKVSGAADYTAPGPNQTAGDSSPESEGWGRVQACPQHAAVQPGRHHNKTERKRACCLRRQGTASISGRSTLCRRTSTLTSCPLPSPRTGFSSSRHQRSDSLGYKFATTIFNAILYLYFHLIKCNHTSG